MATKPKTPKTPAPDVVQQNGFQTLRPGEVLVMHTADKPVFVSDGPPRGGQLYAYVVLPNTPTILRGSLFNDPRGDGFKMLKTGQLERVAGDHGVLPAVEDMSDNYAVAIRRDGVAPPPPRNQTLDHFRHKYLDYSLGESILRLIENGWTEEDAAAILIPEYESAFERRDGSVGRQSWVLLAETIIKNQVAQAEASDA
jgi:hypothetical protein